MKEVVAADVNHNKTKHFTKSKKEKYFRVAKAATRM